MRDFNPNGPDRFTFVSRRIIYAILMIVEIPLAIRLIFKAVGCDSHNNIISFVYSITSKILLPFKIDNLNSSVKGISQNMVVDINAIIAMIVYFFIAWLIVKIISTAMKRKSRFY